MNGTKPLKPLDRWFSRDQNDSEELLASDTDVDSHLNEPPSKAASLFQRYRGFMRTCVELIMCILLAANLWRSGSTSSTAGPMKASDPWSINGTYGRDIEYMSLAHKFDSLWSVEGSQYDTLVRINPGDTEAKPQWGAIGMFHQLHCLSGIRKALQMAREGHDPGINHLDDPHWPHCFWYLRQAALCSADDTIELPREWKSEIQPDGSVAVIRTGTIDGVKDIRACRDSKELYSLRAKHGVKAAGAANDLHELHST